MQDLIENLRLAKVNLAKAKEDLFKAEVAVYESVKDKLPEEGTFKEGDLKIKTGHYYKWNQETLLLSKANFPKDDPWPFVSEYKPDNKSIKYLKEHKPNVYKILLPALVVTPKKPSFEILGMKDDDNA